MLRIGMLFWMAAAIGVGLLLYNVKHEVQGLEQQLARTNRAIGLTHERIHVLHAEWSLLNEPERLRALSERHLDLVPMRPGQFVGTTAIAALPVDAPRADTALAAAEPAVTAQPVAGRTTVAAAQPEARRQPEQRRATRPAEGRPAEARPAEAARTAEPPARLAPQREEPLPPPRQAAPAPRRELDAAAPRQATPAGAAPVVTVSASPSPPPARAPGVSSLGGPGASLPPPVPFSRPPGGN